MLSAPATVQSISRQMKNNKKIDRVKKKMMTIDQMTTFTD